MPTIRQKKLSKKERGFAKDFAETGIGVTSALKNYETTDYNTAGVIACENLKKPKIQQAIAELLPDELLNEKHLELLNASNIDRFSFSVEVDDLVIQEIIQEVAGCKVIYIKKTKNEKIAYISTPDNMARDKALDKAYKLRGLYAPEKSVNVNLNAKAEPTKALELAEKYEAELRKTLQDNA